MRSKSSKSANRGGQGLVEYVLILLLIAVVCITAYSYLGRATAKKMPTLNSLQEGD
jgi:Flp pilus assembly pilin Flp